MRSFILTLLCAALAFSFSGCKTQKAENISADVHQNANADANQNANVTQTNTNTAAAESEEVPFFSDANEALNAGNKYFDADENDKAIDAYKQAVKLNPDLAEAHFRLGVAYAIAESEAEDAETPDAEPTPTPKVRKGKKNERIAVTNSDKAFENAVKAYKKYLKKNPKDDVAHFNLGRTYNKLNEDPEALKSLQQAVKLKPEDSEYQTELGEILIKLAQYEEAVSALKKALKLDETNLQAEELLEKAEAGEKRVGFGANQQKKRLLSERKQ